MAQGTLQLWPPVTINRIVQTTIFRLAMHPLIYDPPIVDAEGKPLRINRFRNYDGRVLNNPQGITLSVFPYHFAKGDTTSNITTHSENAAIVFDSKETTLGGGEDRNDLTAYIKARATIQLKLHMFGYSNQADEDPSIVQGQDTVFEHNYFEWAIRQYAEVIAAVLRSDLHHLPAFPNGATRLLANSFVHHIDFPTATVDQGSNLILHSATVTWHADYYVPIRWRRRPQYLPAEMSDGNILVGYTTDILGVTNDVLYDTIRRVFLRNDGTLVNRADLTDPTTQQPFLTLDQDLMSLIDTAPNGLLDFSFYFRLEDDRPC